MTVDGAFVYVCERGRDNGRVYITPSVITRFFSRGPWRPRYNGVAVYKYCLFQNFHYKNYTFTIDHHTFSH